MLLMICKPSSKRMAMRSSLDRVTESDFIDHVDSCKIKDFTPPRNSTNIDESEPNFDVLMAKLDSLRQS